MGSIRQRKTARHLFPNSLFDISNERQLASVRPQFSWEGRSIDKARACADASRAVGNLGVCASRSTRRRGPRRTDPGPRTHKRRGVMRPIRAGPPLGRCFPGRGTLGGSGRLVAPEETVAHSRSLGSQDLLRGFASRLSPPSLNLLVVPACRIRCVPRAVHLVGAHSDGLSVFVACAERLAHDRIGL